MKRRELLKYLRSQDCLFLREGKRHSVYYNPKNLKTSTIPRHSEISNFLAIKICKDLEIKPI